MFTEALPKPKGVQLRRGWRNLIEDLSLVASGVLDVGSLRSGYQRHDDAVQGIVERLLAGHVPPQYMAVSFVSADGAWNSVSADGTARFESPDGRWLAQALDGFLSAESPDGTLKGVSA